MPQYLIKPEEISNNFFILKDQQARHLTKVLRVKPHERIRLFDGRGKSYSAEVTEVRKDSVHGRVISEIPLKQKNFTLNLYASLIKPEKFELLLEKATEIGVDSIVPVCTERTIIDVGEDRQAGRIVEMPVVEAIGARLAQKLARA